MHMPLLLIGSCLSLKMVLIFLLCHTTSLLVAMEDKENLLKPAVFTSNFPVRINEVASEKSNSDSYMLCTGTKSTRNSWLYCKDGHCSNGSII